MPPRLSLTVPCYNEAPRLRPEPMLEVLARAAELQLVFVDDGSTDQTATVLEALRRRAPQQVVVLQLPCNRGKAEAVRTGLTFSLNQPVAYVGYWDADLATPLETVFEFQAVLDAHPELDMVLGSRVKLLGRHVERHVGRHYLGRVFATVVSLVLQLPVYDTQCGAKLFRSGPALRACLAQPFRSRWVFDVELLARYIRVLGSPERAAAHIYEYPLHQWRDIAGSKVKPTDFLVSLRDVLDLYLRYRLRPR